MPRYPEFNRPVDTWLDSQFRRPSGALGYYVGRTMARQHGPENIWTISQLDLAPDDEILEIGFGPGLAIAAATRRLPGGTITGIDFAPAMAAAARARNAAAVAEGQVRLICGEATHLPLASTRFDAAYAIHSVYFWPDPAAALAELARVLKPAGRIALTILPRERWPANPDGTWGTPECRVYSGPDLVALLAAAGFRDPRIAVDPNREHASSYTVLAAKPPAE